MSENGDRGGAQGGIPDRPERPLRLADLAGEPSKTPPPPPPPSPVQPTVANIEAEAADEAEARRREFAALLGEFRRTAVLVPLDAHGSLWSAEQGGVRWICAFSDEAALARFAYAQGDPGREWEYRTVLGARLLDVMVPMLGVPAGVALDAGSEEGMLFPPVAGVVPDAAAVDFGGEQR
ncbi:SseB family protein [Streptomyces sp. PR69]|uniref:SseB family protein n=1 Tax=Streptomyces sp. PR69 TaxID=2984950 RepID=UPI002264266E|nr:SseB family protein [Streptomyces sp. PR69]